MAQVPLTTHSSTPKPRAEKRFRFGSQTLDLYQPFAFKFMKKQKTALTDVYKCIIDNLWRSSKEPRYFTATINCLAEYFISTTPKKNAYVVYQGRKPGVFKNWSVVVAQIENFKNPYFEGFNEIPQALEAARRRLGMFYFIDLNVLNDSSISGIPSYRDKICEHCEILRREIHDRDLTIASLTQKLLEANQALDNIGITGPTPVTTPSGTVEGKEISKPLMGDAFPIKHIKENPVSITGSSPVQTITGKGLTNPLMDVASPMKQCDNNFSVPLGPLNYYFPWNQHPMYQHQQMPIFDSAVPQHFSILIMHKGDSSRAKDKEKPTHQELVEKKESITESEKITNNTSLSALEDMIKI